jgi:hypothetical protein
MIAANGCLEPPNCGLHMGRPPKLTPHQRQEALARREVPGYDSWPEIVCLGLLMLVFAVWAIGLYVYAW